MYKNNSKILAFIVAVFIIFGSYTFVRLVYEFNLGRLIFPTYKESKENMLKNPNFDKNKYIVLRNNYECKDGLGCPMYYRFYYSPNNYCVVDIIDYTRGRGFRFFYDRASFFAKKEYDKQPVSFLDRVVCTELFGGVSNYHNDIFSKFQIPLIGFYSSIILSLFIFTLFRFKGSSKKRISFYGFIIVIFLLVSWSFLMYSSNSIEIVKIL